MKGAVGYLTIELKLHSVGQDEPEQHAQTVVMFTETDLRDEWLDISHKGILLATTQIEYMLKHARSKRFEQKRPD